MDTLKEFQRIMTTQTDLALSRLPSKYYESSDVLNF